MRGGWWYRLGRFPLPAVIFYMWCAMIDWARASAKSIFCSNVAMRLKVPDVLVHVADPDRPPRGSGGEKRTGVSCGGGILILLLQFFLSCAMVAAIPPRVVEMCTAIV